MSVSYEERQHRAHQPIPHDPTDQTPVDTKEHPLPIYAKRIVALHNIMRDKGLLPTFDPIRRISEELDAQFARGTPPATAPPTLKTRPPTYYERRVLAVEVWLLEKGLISQAELKKALQDVEFPAAKCL